MSAYELNLQQDHQVRLRIGQLDALAEQLGLQKYSTLLASTCATTHMESPDVWRCFHCDESFTSTDAAKEHFGRTEIQSPACLIDIAEYRAMEQRMLAYNLEDAAIHRETNAKLGAHQLALVREEERGYSRGLRDAKRYPAQLGLQPIPVAATQAGDDLRQKDGVA